MSICNLEPLLQEAERRAVLLVLRAHPEWTLADLANLLEQAGARAPLMRTLTLGELLDDPSLADRQTTDLLRLHAAKQATGSEFDALVHQVLCEADGAAVGAAYLRARVGGPRWKLQGSLRRLVAAGLIERSGATSSTRYRAKRGVLA